MPLSRQVRGFGMAVLGGTLAGAAPALALAIIGASTNVASGERIADFWLFTIGLGLCVAFAIVLTASIVVGLPLTMILMRMGWESAPTYTSLGAAIGLLLAFGMNLGLASWQEVVLIGALCTVSGAVTGFVWWRKARAPQTRAST